MISSHGKHVENAKKVKCPGKVRVVLKNDLPSFYLVNEDEDKGHCKNKKGILRKTQNSNF